jgi:hypothetical protein
VSAAMAVRSRPGSGVQEKREYEQDPQAHATV